MTASPLVKSRRALVATLAVALGVLLAGASSASATTIHCHGTVAPLGTNQRDLTYGLTCGEPVRGLTILSSLEVDEFSTTSDVLNSSFQVLGDQSFTCEGDIPSHGFGCFGFSWDRNMITGTFSIDQARCPKGKNRLQAWLVAVDANNRPSGPFRLKVPACKHK